MIYQRVLETRFDPRRGHYATESPLIQPMFLRMYNVSDGDENWEDFTGSAGCDETGGRAGWLEPRLIAAIRNGSAQGPRPGGGGGGSIQFQSLV